MNCDRARAMIDSHADVTPAASRPEAFQSHLDTCAGCRAALAHLEALEARLRALAQPEAPASLVPVIRARTARGNEARSSAKHEEANRSTAPTVQHRFGWWAVCLGVVMGLGAQTYRFLTGASLDWVSPFVYTRLEDHTTMIRGGPAVLILAVGLLLLATGLFGWSRQRTPRG